MPLGHIFTIAVASALALYGAVHPAAGSGYLLAAAGSLLLLSLISHYYSGDIILRVLRAHPADAVSHPDLYRSVQSLSQRAGLRAPRVFVVASDVPNAFATGRVGTSAAVAVTQGLMRRLERRELAGVLAHELAHLKQRQAAGRIFSTLVTGGTSILAGLVRSAMIFSAGGRFPAFAGATAALASVSASLGRLSAAADREFAADLLAADICGEPMWLADALRKLSSESPHGVSATVMSSHPPVAERIRRLEALAYGAYV